MRPNVMGGGSFAGSEDGSSAVDAFASAGAAGTRGMGELIGRGLSGQAGAIAQKQVNDEQTRVFRSVNRWKPKGYSVGSMGSSRPQSTVRDNSQVFESIGGALSQIITGGRSGRQSSSGSGGGAPSWQPPGNDGWGSTPLGARGSNESMGAKWKSGFSFL
jgi:hypothetical protein